LVENRSKYANKVHGLLYGHSITEGVKPLNVKWRESLRERSLGWYRQFREIVPMFVIINIEPICEPL